MKDLRIVMVIGLMTIWLVLAPAGSALNAGPSAIDLPVIPVVQSAEMKAETFALNKLVVEIGRGVASEELQYGLDEVMQSLPSESSPSSRSVKLAVQMLDPLPSEWSGLAEYQRQSYYRLELTPERITVSAVAGRGFFYGLMSLRQILAADPNHIPIGVIRDYPLMELRGPSDDISRGQVSTLDNFKQIIRFCGMYKMNCLMIYMEDLFELKSFPSIGLNRGRLSSDDIRQLEEWGRRYMVEIIPIFQTLGHLENVLIDDQYIGMAEFPGSSALSVSDPAAFNYLEQSIPEVCRSFSSPYFNIGADESFDVGKGENQRLLRRYGIDYLHLQHYQKVFDLVRRENKTIMMYADIMQSNPEIFSGLPKDIILVYWTYRPGLIYTPCEKLKLTGNRYLVSSGIWNWRNIYPDHLNAMVNIENLTRDGYRNGAMGSIISSWGDFGGPNFREFNYYAYAYGADWAWNPIRAERRHFDRYYWRGRSECAAINHTLSILGNQLSFKEYFEYPYQPENYAGREYRAYNVRVETVGRIVDQALLLLTSMPADPIKPYFEWAVGMGQDYVRIQAVMSDLYRMIHYEFDWPDYNRNLKAAAGECRNLANQVDVRRQEYRRLWLSTNREDNLHRIEREFSYLSFFLTTIAAKLDAGQTDIGGTLPGSFIAARKSDGTFSSGAFYRYNLRLDGKPKSAHIQLVAEGIATLWINGREVGQVKAHHSGSLLVQQERVKAWDVTAYLKPGTNSIAIQARAFRRDSVLVYACLQWRDKNGEFRRLTTSPHWRASADTFEGWQSSEACFEQWNWAESHPPVDVYTRPWLEEGFPSRIQK
ncbi:MAG: family 20 glycosylhydrolase [Candidatus Delongbacteria bacterium]|nr:family 20 glycosylhydrolase [Candidatus Delongbacteria bacterium]